MNEYEVLTAPLDGLADGLLVVRRGLGNVTLVGDETMAELFTARCTGRTLRARCTGGVVELTSSLVASAARTHTDISLNGAVAWAIEVAGGVSDLQADLVRLHAFDPSTSTVASLGPSSNCRLPMAPSRFASARSATPRSAALRASRPGYGSGGAPAASLSMIVASRRAAGR